MLVLKELLFLILIGFSSLTYAQRGIEFNETCEEIDLAEKALNSIEVRDHVYTGLHRGQDALMIYYCDVEDWSMLMHYGAFDEEEALTEVSLLRDDLIAAFGKPDHGYQELNFIEKILIFKSTFGMCCGRDTTIKNTSKWSFDDHQIRIYPQLGTPLAEDKNTWSIVYAISQHMQVEICESISCDKIRFDDEQLMGSEPN